MAKEQFIHMAGVPYPADATWAPSTLRRAFGHPLPAALAAHQNDSGAVPLAAVDAFLDQLCHAALQAFEQHSEIAETRH